MPIPSLFFRSAAVRLATEEIPYLPMRTGGTMLRYTIEKMSEAERRQWMRTPATYGWPPSLY